MKAFCLGYSHKKCDTCQHEENWQTLNQMPNALRLSMQADMVSISTDKCRLTNMGEYSPTSTWSAKGGAA